MKQSIFKISENVKIANDVYCMVLIGDTTAITKPGQFVNIALNGFYLRRPISVCDWSEESLTILYKVVGEGTKAMSVMEPGETLDILTGLGNGYNIETSGQNPLLVGGGVGVPPLYGLAKRLIANGTNPHVIMGFNSKEDVFYVEEFERLGATVTVATVDGTMGIKGFVTDAIDNQGSYLYTCGPEPMLHALYEKVSCDGQFSFEERMGCGFGACMGCSCETIYGSKRICKEGPVLEKGEILW